MNKLGSSLSLNDAAGLVCDPSPCLFTALAITAQLTGSLTITGIVDAAGVAAPWVLAPATAAGVYQAPGAKHSGGNSVWYSLSNAAADANKAVLSWTYR